MMMMVFVAQNPERLQCNVQCACQHAPFLGLVIFLTSTHAKDAEKSEIGVPLKRLWGLFSTSYKSPSASHSILPCFVPKHEIPIRIMHERLMRARDNWQNENIKRHARHVQFIMCISASCARNLANRNHTSGHISIKNKYLWCIKYKVWRAQDKNQTFRCFTKSLRAVFLWIFLCCYIYIHHSDRFDNCTQSHSLLGLFLIVIMYVVIVRLKCIPLKIVSAFHIRFGEAIFSSIDTGREPLNANGNFIYFS